MRINTKIEKNSAKINFKIPNKNYSGIKIRGVVYLSRKTII